MKIRTYSAKPTEVERKWHIVDASGISLGRLATRVATLLQGKQKPMFTNHIDCGDFVVVINTDKIKITGDKLKQKRYYRHSGYPGGIKSQTLEQLMEKDSTRVIENAVRGMLPSNKLRDKRLLRLKLYQDDDHPHEAQQPKKMEIGK
ncbi:MAG: 50S ribosomal protein L13 [Candidatus Saccharimonadales bacterium]